MYWTMFYWRVLNTDLKFGEACGMSRLTHLVVANLLVSSEWLAKKIAGANWRNSVPNLGEDKFQIFFVIIVCFH